MQKEKILIVDDSEMNRSILADMLMDDYDIIEAEDGVEAVAILRKQVSELSLVLLDIVMPRMDGFGVLEAMNQNRWIESVPVVIISAENSPSQVERAYELGGTDFIMRPFDALIVRRRVVNTLLLYAKQKRLISMVEEQVYEKERHSDLMIDILSHIMEFRNGESGLHILHVRTLTDFLLTRLTERTDRYHLTMADIALISTASALHDIGKMAIDEKILNKPGRLTNEEFAIMKTHSTIGAGMLSDLPVHQEEPLVKIAYQICRWHHERWDGRGYPDGLAGDDIPISAQVVALADVYDALTSQRVYKPPFTHEKAVEMIVGGECGAFNPLLLECLKENAGELLTALEADSSEDIRRRKLRGISDEALRGEGGASQRTLRLLDKERMRNSFYASMSEAIQFEYTVSPSMITVSAWGAKKLGVDEIIMDPLRDERLQGVLGDSVWEQLSRRLRNTTPSSPEVRLDCPLHYDGATRWHRVIMRALWSDDIHPQFEGALGTVMDIHEAHQKMQELEQKASKDLLTGLLNRASAKEQIELRMQDNPDSHFALAEVDIDDFKKINDVYGHMFGDQVLQQLARQMKGSVRRSDICCRAGGEEFFLFLEYNTDIEKTIDRIYKRLCFTCEDRPVTVSMGVALGETVGLSYEALYHAADLALYTAKRSGKRQYRFYDKTMEETLSTMSDAGTGGDAPPQ